MDAMHGRAGNALLVNGKTQSAKGTVAAGSVERWRLVNSATARTLALTLAGASFRVIGTDGGLLPAPYIPERLELAVGQRYDLEVTFDGSPGSSVTLAANVLAEVSGQVQKVALPLVEYDIQGTVAGAKPVYPPITLPAVDVSAKEQLISLGGHTEGGKLVYTINGASGDDVPMLMLAQNEPVTLRIVNEIGPFHPFHLHGQFFQILTRNGSPTQEPGLKDTVLLDSMEEVTVLSHFENPGEWMYHCHIGQHAELGMMGHVMVSSAH
jgi:FtsP/CotA-like multicopper oxidase with cupredoxin domain